MSDMFNSVPFLDLRDRYVHELEQDDDPDKLKMRLAAMAHALQMTLSLPSTEKAVPHRWGLDFIMRGVAHDIEGNSMKKSYVLDNIKRGLASLQVA